MSEQPLTIDGKTAHDLVNIMATNRDDYQHNIYQAALRLATSGFGQAVYKTQWSSGTTLWETGDSFIQVKATWGAR
jgi:hypothetical protein